MRAKQSLPAFNFIILDDPIINTFKKSGTAFKASFLTLCIVFRFQIFVSAPFKVICHIECGHFYTRHHCHWPDQACQQSKGRPSVAIHFWTRVKIHVERPSHQRQTLPLRLIHCLVVKFCTKSYKWSFPLLLLFLFFLSLWLFSVCVCEHVSGYPPI